MNRYVLPGSLRESFHEETRACPDKLRDSQLERNPNTNAKFLVARSREGRVAFLQRRGQSGLRLRFDSSSVDETGVAVILGNGSIDAIEKPEVICSPDFAAKLPMCDAPQPDIAMPAHTEDRSSAQNLQFPSPTTQKPATSLKPSSKSLKLRKKQDSAIAGGRNVTLEYVPNPACYNCRASFVLAEEPVALAPYSCSRCGACQVVPAQIDHFVLERELGRGGMGVTYRAFDHSLQRNVAVKLISESRATQRESVDELIREARRAATLSHPNIVPIYSIGSVDGMPYVVMELLSDSQLSRPVSKSVPLGEIFVMETGLAVTKALAEAASHGLLHLDVKPGNILHDRFGVAKLIDFGLASYFNDDRSKGWGTCLYMAPERLMQKSQDFRSDQYSLGLTLWQALAGRAPFSAPDEEQLSTMILKEEAPLLNHVRTDLLEWTAGLIHKMIAFEAGDRYQGFAELTQAFEVVLNALRGKQVDPSA